MRTDSLFAFDHYPKLFWEPSIEGPALFALGKEHGDNLTTPLFYQGTPAQSYHPSCMQEFSFQEFPFTSALPKVIKRLDIPDYKGWEERVEKALDHIDRGSLQKVVLSRKTILRFSSKLDPWTLFFRLRKQAAPSTTRFCLQYEKHRAFLGATPEKLFERDGLCLTTMALAGTAPRSSDLAQDKVFSSQLLACKKRRSEVDFVLDFLATQLRPFSQTVEIGPLGILQSTAVQHLHYPLRATLKEGVSDEMLLSALHPTPALAGLPREKALSFIKEHEPFDRGLYGAPIGFLSQKKSDIVVAIRSAYLKDTELHLFAGLGIVPGSNALEEWQELEAKISPFLSIL
jgi:menaquinone-specific isochorismate synthase